MPLRHREVLFGRTVGLLCLATTVGLMTSPPARAQEPDTEPTGSSDASDAANDDPLADVEVIRVKGRGLDAIEPEVPTSITQFDADEIAALGAQDISDLARVTPNVEIVTISATAPTFFIRGVGLNDFNANAPGAVAVYQDGVPLNAPAIQLGQLFDVQDVQILRGPQGYGDDRNASGGAIKITSRRPDGQLGASLRADYGNFDFKDFEGALSVPLVEEVLSTRLAFRFTERDGFIKNRCGDKIDEPRTFFRAGKQVCNELSRRGPEDVFIPPGLPTRVQDIGSWAARGQLLLQPRGTEMEFLLNAHGGRIDHFSPLGQPIGTGRSAQGPRTGIPYSDPKLTDLYQKIRGSPAVQDRDDLSPTQKTTLANQLTLNAATRDISQLDVYRNDYDLTGSEVLDSVGAFLRGDVPLGPVRLTSITGGERYWRSRVTDFDMTSNPMINIATDDDAYQITQSLSVGGELADAPFAWQTGAYYLGESLASSTRFDLRLQPNIATPLLQQYRQDFHSLGIYGNFRWDFADDLSLEGGVRWNWEDKSFDLELDAPGRPAVLPSSVERTWSAPTGGLVLSYRLDDDVSIYGKYTRGWKTGHFNASVLNLQRQGDVLATADITTAEPETIDAFEIGLRGIWLDGRLSLGAALFYYKYVDYQVFLLANEQGSAPQLEVINANDAEVYGAELDLRAEPLAGWVPAPFDGLNVTARFGWLESQFLDFTDERGDTITIVIPGVGPVVFPRTVIADFTGNSLPNSPRFKISGAVEYPLDMGRWGMLVPRYDFIWTDDVFFDPSEGRGVPAVAAASSIPFGDYALGQPAYWVHNARIGYRPAVGNLELALWVRNFTNTVYKTYVADASVNFSTLLNWVGEPRTYGGSISIYY